MLAGDIAGKTYAFNLAAYARRPAEITVSIILKNRAGEQVLATPTLTAKQPPAMERIAVSGIDPEARPGDLLILRSRRAGSGFYCLEGGPDSPSSIEVSATVQERIPGWKLWEALEMSVSTVDNESCSNLGYRAVSTPMRLPFGSYILAFRVDYHPWRNDLPGPIETRTLGSLCPQPDSGHRSRKCDKYDILRGQPVVGGYTTVVKCEGGESFRPGTYRLQLLVSEPPEVFKEIEFEILSAEPKTKVPEQGGEKVVPF